MLSKAERKVEEDDIPSAKQAFRLCLVFYYLAIMGIGLVGSGILMGIILGITLNR